MLTKVFLAVFEYFSAFTIEPALFLFTVGNNIERGSAVQTNLLIWSLCSKDLNFTEQICQNLSLSENNEYEVQVHKKLQNFELIGDYIGLIPAFGYSFFSGFLSDKFGRRKPLMIIPQTGLLIAKGLLIVNFAFINTLPTEFFYVTNFYKIFGGAGMLWLGAHAYASDISDDKCKSK